MFIARRIHCINRHGDMQNHANFTAHMASRFTNYTKLAVLPYYKKNLNLC